MKDENSNCEEFEKLRLKRIKSQKEKIIKYIAILKSDKLEHHLLDELLTKKDD